MPKNKKLVYSILAVVIVVVAIGLFVLINSTITSTPEDQLIVRQSGGSAELIPECGNRSYITKTADYIIEGTVEKVKSRWEKKGIFTYSTLRIENYVKGTPLPYAKLQIITPGGKVGLTQQGVEDQPIFYEGHRVRIYFKEKNGEFSIVCAQMGVEEI